MMHQAPGSQDAGSCSSRSLRQTLSQALDSQAADAPTNPISAPRSEPSSPLAVDSIERQGASLARENSENSSVIDRVPHRPPEPTEDFEAYSRYVAGLSSEEYNNMFYVPLFPGEMDDGLGSDVDSNERYVQSFNMDLSDSNQSSSLGLNTNNSIGSRERAQEVVSRHQEAYQQSVNQSTTRHIAHAVQLAAYVDDVVEGRGQRTNQRHRLNNAVEPPASSSDVLHRPPRSSTVPPPPLSHRVPRLEDQTEAERARHREMFRRFQTGTIQQPPSSESGLGESTDSGEYTIRDGSLPSSGSYNGHLEQDRESPHLSSTSSQRARAALTVTLAASMLPPAEGSRSLTASTLEISSVRMDPELTGYLVMGLIALTMWLLGYFTAKCLVSFKFHSPALSHQHPSQGAINEISINVGDSLARSSTPGVNPDLRRLRRRTHQGAQVYLTPAGECVHFSRTCQTIQGSKVVIQKHLCTCCFPMPNHLLSPSAVPPENT